MSTKFTPESLDALLSDLESYCLDTDTPPSNYELRRFGISEDCISKYRHFDELRVTPEMSEDEAEEIRQKIALSERVKKFDAFRNHFYLQLAIKNPKVIGLSNFALKQPQNGGWTDRDPTAAGSTEITIKLDALGGGEAGK